MKIQTLAPFVAAGALALVVSSNVQGAAASSSQHIPTQAHAARRRLPLPGEFNVLVIVLDDLGTDQLAMYGADTGAPAYCPSTQINATPTPSLDALRASGVMFTRCYANPTCSPTRSALMTGRYGKRTGIGHAINPSDSPSYELPASEMALPELLREANTAGYARGAFGKWHLTDYTTNDCHPASQGFQTFKGHMGNAEEHFEWRKVTSLGGSPSGCGSTASEDIPAISGQAPSESNWDAGVTRLEASAWINAQGSSPFFAYVCFNPPHVPFQVPPYRVLSPNTRGRLAFLNYEAGDVARTGEPDDAKLIYHSSIEGVDYEIGKLLTDMPADVLEKTMVFVVGDNGTVADAIASASMTGHGKRTLFELGTRVPLIVGGPLVRTPNSTCRALVGVVDLWRTIAQCTGLRDSDIATATSGALIDSVSFMHLIEVPTLPGNRTIAYSEMFQNGTPPPANMGYRRGMTDGTHRYMRNYSDSGFMTENFYDQAADPCESTDLLNPPAILTPAQTTALATLQAAMNAL